MNRGDLQKSNIGEFRIEPEPSHIGHMNRDHENQAMTSIYVTDPNCEIRCLSKSDNEETEVFREGPATSNGGVPRRRFGANGAHNENQLEEPELRRIGLEEEGQEDNAESLGPLRAFQGGEVRVSSRNRNGSDVESVDDDGGSSVCSENVYGGSSGDFMSPPCGDVSSRWSTLERNSKLRRRDRESLLESLEKQRRESMESRLKELRLPNKRHSVSSSLLSTAEMPIIAKSKPLTNATLPKQMRRASYQSVIVTPFFAKSGLSVTKPLLLGLGGPEMRERRGSMVSLNEQTPPLTGSAGESFPLRAAGSLSGIDHLSSTSRNVASAKLMRALSSELQRTRKPDDDDLERRETMTVDSSLGTKIQNMMLDASLGNGCLNDYSAQELRHPRHDAFSNRNEQIRDSKRSDFAENSGVASETERESLDRTDVVLPRITSSLKPDSPPIVSGEFYSAPDAFPPVKQFRPASVETMEQTESDERVRGVSATDPLPDKLLNGSYSSTKEFCSDRNSDASSTDNDDKHHEMKNSSFTQNLQTPASYSSSSSSSIETCREDKVTTIRSPALCLRTSAQPQETFLSREHWRENENETKANLDNTRPREVPYNRESTNQNQVPVYPAVSRRFSSDIQIQVKGVEPVFPARFEKTSNNATCNGGGKRDDLLREREQSPIDDDLERVTPNWSSYPGPLPDGFRSSDINDTASKPVEEINIPIEAPERSVSTLEINLRSPSVDGPEKASRKEASQTGKCDYSCGPNRSNVSTVLSLRADANVDFRHGPDFNDRRKREELVKNVTGEVDVFATPQKSVERNEIFVKEDSTPTTARTLTLPRDHRSRRPWNQFETQTRGSGRPSRDPHQQQLSYSPKQELTDGVGTSTPDDVSFEMTPTKANVTSFEMTPSKANVTRIEFYSTKDEQRTRYRDGGGERTRSSYETIGGISKSGDSWQASVVKREDRWRDSRMSADSRSPEKTPSVERIWETLEQPRTRLTKRNLRPESDSENVGPKTAEKSPPHEYPQRSLVASNGGWSGVEVKADALVRSTSLQDSVTEGSEEGGESLLEIEVLKGGLGLGFCIEGGKDGPYGDRPITVKRLFRGSSDSKFSSGSKDSLRAGDEILSANGRNMTLLSRFVAWNFLKTLPEGTIKLLVRRRQLQPGSGQLQQAADDMQK